MNIRTNPAFQRAQRYIAAEINSGRYTKNMPLPAMKKLAAEAGVSENTMLKAARFFRTKGALSGGNGENYIVDVGSIDNLEVDCDFNAQSSEYHCSNSTYIWQRIRDSIRKDIFSSKYAPSSLLPTMLEFQNHYRASFRTVRKALLSLASEGIIVPRGKSYAVVAASKAPAGKKIIFFTLASRSDSFADSGIPEQFLRELGHAVFACGASLEIYTYLWEEDGHCLRSRRNGKADFPPDDEILGFVYLSVNPFDPKRHEVLAHVHHRGKPVAILDISGGLGLPLFMYRKNVRLFTAAVSKHPGILAARFLLDRGHRSVAYISPYHDSPWSKNRLNGIKEVYADAGHGAGVSCFAFSLPPSIHDTYRKQAEERSNINAFEFCYRQWLSTLPRTYQQVIDPVVGSELKAHLITLGEFRDRLNSLFSQALAQNEITAWIAANDQTALAALDFLAENNIKVPERISVFGFDDSRETLQRGLTSFNFNMRAIVQLMVSFILNIHSVRQTRKPLEVDGIVADRLTVRKL
ncbi:MAG: GntR family transcriptional regulator [Chitinivibrionales bacterium]|nr:GntR family transcriptional regulator [Chitinivibrionales bacterium]